MERTTQSAGTTSSDFLLQWGNRKRLRCMKFQDHSSINKNSPGTGRPTTRNDRRVIRSDLNSNTNNSSDKDPNSHQLNLRKRNASASHRTLRNSDSSSIAMKGHNNGVKGGLGSSDGVDNHNKKDASTIISNKNKNNTSNHHHHHNNHHNGGGSGGSGSSETGGEPINTVVWPPKFAIALTNKEKEEDFMAIKGSKLPQRPKKRAKFIQRTLNLVSPGTWLCDLTLERYEVEVREKKASKKLFTFQRPRGLKAMSTMESDSE